MSLMGLLFGGNTADPIKLYYGFANSMQKEFNRADDGTILSEKHTFNIRGVIVPSPVGTDKIMPSGAFNRYSSLVGQTSRDMIETDTNDFIVGRLWNLRAGPLRLVKLAPDPANPGQYIPSGIPALEYKFAQLINITIAEAPEDTAGIHFQEVSMSFEAVTGPRIDSDLENTYRLKAAAEQFEIKKEEDRMSYFIFDGDGAARQDHDNPYYSYTITHTISAQGLPMFYNDFPGNQTAIENNADGGYSYNNSGNYNYEKMRKPSTSATASSYPKFEAFYEAYNYVQRKKRNSLLGGIVYTDIHGRSYLGSNAFMPTAWDIANYENIIPAIDDTDGKIPTNGPDGNPLPIPDGEYEEYATSKYGGSFLPRVSGERPVPASGAMISQRLWDSGVYGEYNVVRTSTVDMIAGSYSLTTTYFYSRSPATIEINGSYEKGEDGNDVVKVEGTITGLDSRGVSSDMSNKYNNARNVFYTICQSGINTQANTTYIDPIGTTTVQNNNNSGIPSPSNNFIVDASGKPFNNPIANRASGLPPYGDATKTFAPWGIGTSIFTFANKIFQDNSYTPFYNSNMVLDIRPLSTSITENKVGGTIQFSATYRPIPKTIRDIKLKIPNCIAVALNIQDDNKYRKLDNFSSAQHSQYSANALASGVQTQQIASVMVLGRSIGPILQNMSTTKQSERKVTLEATVDVAERYPESLCIVSGIAVALDYYPPNTARFYLTELQDTWDWANGKITVNVGWTYTR